MKIKQLKVKNFKGISELELSPESKVTIITGKNGSGKTSLSEAIIYALTGKYPEKAIKDEQITMEVYADFDEFNLSRIQTANKPNKVKFNGKDSTVSVLSQEISKLANVSEDALKITTSEEVVRNLTSGELGDFLMTYVPEDLTVETVLKYFPSAYKDMTEREITDAKIFLEEMFIGYGNVFGLDSLKDVATQIVDKRKFVKKQIAELEANLKTFPEDVQTRTLEEIDRDLENLLKKEGESKALQSLINSYNNALTTRKKQQERLIQLDNEIKSISATEPDVNLLNKINQEKTNISNQMIDLSKSIKLNQDSIATYKKTIEKLSTNFCPLSDKLLCTTDKTPLKEEFENAVRKLEEIVKKQSDNLSSLKVKVTDFEKQLTAYYDNSSAYDKKVLLLKQKESLENGLIEIPQKPDDMQTFDFTKEKGLLFEEKKLVESLTEKKKIQTRLSKLKYDRKLYEFLVKVLDAKGCVMEQITEQYMSIFNDVCNERAKRLKKGMEIKFVAEDGVKITCKPSQDKPFLPFESLSTGEKTCALFLLMDMLNSLTGLGILLLDGDSIGALDEDVIIDFLDLVLSDEVQNDYDHVILNLLDNEKTLNYLKNKNIDLVTM